VWTFSVKLLQLKIQKCINSNPFCCEYNDMITREASWIEKSKIVQNGTKSKALCRFAKASIASVANWACKGEAFSNHKVP
jgi:hypothetical protein